MSNRASPPKHVRRVRARGRTYYYFNTGKVENGRPVLARLPDMSDPGFWGSYAAMVGHRNRRPKSGMLLIPDLIALYEKSPQYRGLAKSSRENYDIYLRRLAKLMPTAPAAEVTRGDMRRLIDKMADTPGAANLFLGTCGALFKWAAGNEYIAASPTQGIKPLKMGEHAPWPQHVLDAALKADDDNVRLLTHLLYYTALRINDALSLTWANIAGDTIIVRPQKTQRKGQQLTIPIHRDLAAELARHPRNRMMITVNPNTNRRWGDEQARNVLKEFAALWGVKIVPHGLRKNAVIALLEAGCSVAETAAISGQTLQLVEHYAKQRDQSKLAKSAMRIWEGNAR